MAYRGRDAERESFWRGVLVRHAASGLSVTAFCRREKLSQPSFYSWRRTIPQRDRHARNSVKSKPLKSCQSCRAIELRILHSAPLRYGARRHLVHALFAEIILSGYRRRSFRISVLVQRETELLV